MENQRSFVEKVTATNSSARNRMIGEAMRIIRRSQGLTCDEIATNCNYSFAPDEIEEGHFTSEQAKAYVIQLGYSSVAEVVSSAIMLLQTSVAEGGAPPQSNPLAASVKSLYLQLPSMADIAWALAGKKYVAHDYLHDGQPNRTKIAKAMGLTRDTLHDKLEEIKRGEGHGFHDIHYKKLALDLGMAPDHPNPHAYLIGQYVDQVLNASVPSAQRH